MTSYIFLVFKHDRKPATVALRTLDALHLSIAHDFSAKTLATADKIMAQAAQLIGIKVEWFGAPQESQ